MGVGGADWLERDERVNEERPQLAVKLLGLKPGMTVADVGAGSGYYTELLAKAVGPNGKVIATDIQPGMIEILRRRFSAGAFPQVEVLLSREDDARLPAGSLDLILLVDVYHEFSKPQQMLRKLRASLKTGGQIVFLEFRKEDASVPIRQEHKMSIAEVRAEVEPEGFRFVKVLNNLPWQHMIFFER
jgi:ubiquinone/menaquinone biosynthesis C-methylase UbiE